MKVCMRAAAVMMVLALCPAMCQTASAEEQIAPNLAFARIKFADNVWEFTYTGEEIIPEFTVYVGAAEVPAQAYTYTVISTDGDGTSAGTNPGVVTFQISAVEDPIFYGEKNETFTILPAEDIGEPLPGDVNADGRLDASDAALLQNWLLTVPDAALADPAAADLNGDGILNAADLSMMKRALIQAYEPASAYRIDPIGYSDELLHLAGSDRSAAVICSAEELEAYLAPITVEENVAAYLAEYPDSFFEDHVLLLNCIYQSCGGDVMYEITSVFYRDNVLNVVYRDLYELMPYPDIVNGLLAQVIIPKEQYHADAVVWECIEHDLL